jgi:hypothetical protein
LQKTGAWLVREASVPLDVIDDAEFYLKKLGGDFHIDIIPDRGPQASLEWLVPTVFFIFFTKTFLDTLAKEMANDTYKLTKAGISSIWSKFFGPNPKYKYRKIVSGKKPQNDLDYSLAFSIYTELSERIKINFLYKPNWNHAEFDEATDVYLNNIALFCSGQQSELTEIIKNVIINRA